MKTNEPAFAFLECKQISKAILLLPVVSVCFFTSCIGLLNLFNCDKRNSCNSGNMHDKCNKSVMSGTKSGENNIKSGGFFEKKSYKVLRLNKLAVILQAVGVVPAYLIKNKIKKNCNDYRTCKRR